MDQEVKDDLARIAEKNLTTDEKRSLLGMMNSWLFSWLLVHAFDSAIRDLSNHLENATDMVKVARLQGMIGVYRGIPHILKNIGIQVEQEIEKEEKRDGR